MSLFTCSRSLVDVWVSLWTGMSKANSSSSHTTAHTQRWEREFCSPYLSGFHTDFCSLHSLKYVLNILMAGSHWPNKHQSSSNCLKLPVWKHYCHFHNDPTKANDRWDVSMNSQLHAISVTTVHQWNLLQISQIMSV